MSHLKMDTNKALSILGLPNLRWLDPSTGVDPKEALDKALFEGTQMLCKSRSAKPKKEPKKSKFPAYGNQTPDVKPTPKQTEEKYASDVRNLHEAYQFLARKYNLVPKRKSKVESTNDVGSYQDFFSTIDSPGVDSEELSDDNKAAI